MKCLYNKPSGDQCGANAMNNSNYCYLHNPEISQEDKLVAQTKGGEARAVAIKTALPEIPLNNPNDTVTLMADTISKVRAGEMDIRVANCLGFLTDKLLKAFEVARLNDKVEFIERIILEKRTI